MEAVMRTAGRRARGLLLKAADRAGEAVRSVPGAAGALLLSWGLGEVYHPLLWISAGLFLIALDRRLA